MTPWWVEWTIWCIPLVGVAAVVCAWFDANIIVRDIRAGRKPRMWRLPATWFLVFTVAASGALFLLKRYVP